MPSTNEHLERSRHNIRFAETFDLLTTPYLDWVVTAYFYAALHLVDALLDAKDSLQPPDHQIRWGYVRDKWYLRPIKLAYRDLKNHSENARYNLLTFTTPKMNNEIIPLYREIEAHIIQQLPKDGIKA